jgi:hypothetical protein
LAGCEVSPMKLDEACWSPQRAGLGVCSRWWTRSLSLG